MTRTTHRAGDRRISLPSPARARAVLLRRQPAEDLSDVVAFVRCPARRCWRRARGHRLLLRPCPCRTWGHAARSGTVCQARPRAAALAQRGRGDGVDDRCADRRARPRHGRLHCTMHAADRRGRGGADDRTPRRRLNQSPMSFADHIRACNNYDRARVVPLLAGGRRIGWLRRGNAAALARFDTVFAVEPDRVRLVAEGDADRVTAAVDAVVEALVVEKSIPKWRDETFDVMPRWGDPPLFRLDRGAVPFFGVRAYGVHLNGYRYVDGGLQLRIGRGERHKRVAPDKLDNIVAGGIGNGYGTAP